MRTQVAIIGAGPAGLLLGRLLEQSGIDSIILERRSREYVLGRIRAGVLETGSVALLRQAGLGARMQAEGLEHDGCSLAFDGDLLRLDFRALIGRAVVVYGQTEVTRDLMRARDDSGQLSVYEAEAVVPIGFDGDHPRVSYRKDGVQHEIACDVIAGCDGFHGVCRASLPEAAVDVFERVWPFGWLGVLVDQPPVADELIYAHHARGFALCSMRSPSRSRYYVQVPGSDTAGAWSDAAFWDELRRRLPASLAEALRTGPSIEKSVAPLRSFVVEPLRFGRLFLAGDAAHIVPPTGAKGLNLALADVALLADALRAFFVDRSTAGMDAYSSRALRRIWRAERFSWWMTSLLHVFPEASAFERRLQRAEFDHLAVSAAAQVSVAENYTGLPSEPELPAAGGQPDATAAAQDRTASRKPTVSVSTSSYSVPM
jgi:p-hydroxybenzoate 3-monooxygenase